MGADGTNEEGRSTARRAASSPGREPGGRPGPPGADAIRRRRLALGGALAALLVLGVGAIAFSGGDDGRSTATAYAAAWARADWAAMHARLTEEARTRTGLVPFAQANREAIAIATGSEGAITTGEPQKRDGDVWRVPVSFRTRVFGTVRGAVDVPVVEDGDARRVAWTRALVFPGLRGDEQLTRSTRLLARGDILARDKVALAEGPERTSPIPEVAQQVVGRVEPAPPEQRARLVPLGVPADAPVGVSGLERIFDARLTGVPAGELKAGPRTIARGAGRAGEDVRTTISPDVVRASVTALAGRVGGAVAFEPRSGAVLGYAGAPFSLLQPPGSTFKVVTTAGALEEGTVKLSDTFPFEQRALLSGVPLSNAGGETCGGTLEQAFAESCNSVFAPMGVKLGPRDLVRTAERFGFNRPPQFPTVAESTIPQADAIGDDLAVGSTAIGQGQVQATTLEMAETAGVIANDGVRRRLTLDFAVERRRDVASGERVVSARTARQMQRLMRAVVREGTGTAAGIDGVPVAGKTGTAELRSREPGDTSSNPDDTTAWFVAYAPAGGGREPRVAVAVMLAGQGAGGETAAPAAREILVSALAR